MFTVIFLKCFKNLFKMAVKLPCSSHLLACELLHSRGKLNAFCFPRQTSAFYETFHVFEGFLSLFLCLFIKGIFTSEQSDV